MMRNVPTRGGWLALLAATGLTHGAGAESEGPLPDVSLAPSARQIMQRVDERPRGQDQVSSATWRLVNKSGRERVRETRLYRLDPPGEEEVRSKWLVVFDTPRDIRDTALLIWSAAEPEAADHQWLYLPGLRKVKRVATGDRGASFMGTDFAFDDLTERAVDEDAHTLLRTEEVNGSLQHVIESVPRDENSPYSRRIQWVDAETWTVRRIEFYARNGRLEKTLEAEWQAVDDVWAWKRLEMANLRTGHRTVVEVDEVETDTGLGDDIFSENALRLGVR